MTTGDRKGIVQSETIDGYGGATLEWLNWLGIAGGVASVLGLLIAYAVLRRGERQKILVYDNTPPVALASIFPQRTEHRLSIVYERSGKEPVTVEGVYAQFVRLANLGRETIRRDDLVDSDPLRLEVSGAAVLDIAKAGVTRDVIDFQVSAFREHGESTTSLLTFNFLDFQDGALIQILTDRRYVDIRIEGTVIGMPQGIRRSGESTLSGVRAFAAFGFIGLLYTAAIAAAVYVFDQAVDDLSLLWVLLIPLAVLFLPGIVGALAIAAVSPSGVKWPSAIRFPGWFLAMHQLSYAHPHYRLEGMVIEPKETPDSVDSE